MRHESVAVRVATENAGFACECEHRRTLRSGLAVAVVACMALACGSGDGSNRTPTGGTTNPPPAQPTYDVDRLGIPKFVNIIYLDLSQKRADGQPLVEQISKFRSSQGHDYSDAYESCRSMKHYFSFPDSTTRVFAPVAGTVAYYDAIGPGTAIQDRIDLFADAQPAFVFTIAHLVLDKKFVRGEHVAEGQLLGHHVGSSTSSDIVVLVNDGSTKPSLSGYGPGGRLISYFETLTDAAFKVFKDRGINAPADVIITRAQRDANPIRCVGEAFDRTLPDPLPGVVRF